MENQDIEQIYKMRHSAEHVLNQAMQQLGYKFHMALGPAIEDGFYSDFELLEGELAESDFVKLENKMRQIVNQDLPISRQVVSEKVARKIFEGNPYKQELIDELVSSGEDLSVYWTGEPNQKDSFVDLCKGPHVDSTKQIGVLKLLSVAGAYWRGNEKNKMLTRVYGTAFSTKEELDDYLKMLEEAEARNHRKIGKELNLFVFSEIVGKGLPLWTERGSIIRRELERFVVEEELKRGYIHVYTPDIARVALYEKSGHYPYYKESMYNPIEDEDEQFMLRPMTCPHHFELYLSKPRSYKELPMRIAELAKLYRYEKSGELTGLQRVRSFCLADAHIICADNKQAKSEVKGALDLIEYMSEVFGLKQGENYRYRLSLGDRSDEKKYYKDDKAWDDAEEILRQVLKERKAEFFEAEGEAAFYGPKIDIQMKNVYGKEDTAFTVQYDFVMPKRFDLKYIDQSGEEKEAIVVHRSSVGAIERVLAFLIEHYAGAFPVWMHFTQARILPLSDKQVRYAENIKQQLLEANPNLRIEVDDSNETLQKKIRNAQMDKIPYMLVVGGKEEENKSVNVRLRNGEQLGEITVDDFAKRISKIAKERSLEL